MNTNQLLRIVGVATITLLLFGPLETILLAGSTIFLFHVASKLSILPASFTLTQEPTKETPSENTAPKKTEETSSKKIENVVPVQQSAPVAEEKPVAKVETPAPKKEAPAPEVVATPVVTPAAPEPAKPEPAPVAEPEPAPAPAPAPAAEISTPQEAPAPEVSTPVVTDSDNPTKQPGEQVEVVIPPAEEPAAEKPVAEEKPQEQAAPAPTSTATTTAAEEPAEAEINNGTLTITDIPSNLHGLIIGPQASILKQIQADSGATVQLPKKGETSSDIIITGPTSSAVAKAKELIYEKVAHKLPKKFKVEYTIPPIIARYIVGEKGANLKKCEAASNCKIVIAGEDKFEIHGDNEKAAAVCFEAILESLKEYYWFYNQEKKEFYEDNEMDKVVKEAMAKVDEEARLRSEAYAAASKAHEAGDGALAKEMSEKGKQHDANMKAHQKEAQKKIFDWVNAKHGGNPMVIDLHGLQVAPALEFVEQRIAELRAQGKTGQILSVIPGAGNHSGEEGPKIKPAVEKYFNENGIKFEQVRNGQFDATL